MILQNAVRSEMSSYGSSGFTSCTAWLALTDEQATSRAIIASNINTLRRYASFAYLVSLGYNEESCRAEDIGDDARYLDELDVVSGETRHWFPSLDFSKETTCAVTAVLDGDIGPFVHLLENDEFSMICVGRSLSQREVVEELCRSGSTLDCITRLVSDNGFIVTVRDGVKFNVITQNDEIIQCF